MLKKKQIDAYDGYGKKGHVYAYGRVVKSKAKRVDYSSISWLYNLGQSIRRIFVKVLEDEDVIVRVGNAFQSLESNSDGYYQIDWNTQEFIGKSPIDQVMVELKSNPEIKSRTRIYCTATKANYGVVSDIDDTILVTNVLSIPKAVYNSIFVAARKRKSIHGASHWYQSLAYKANCSLFYLSNSPWNLYYYLQSFLNYYRFPEGPMLLRDFGIKKKDDLQVFGEHKTIELEKLLSFYSDLTFIFIGDGGEHDADVYLKLNEKYPGRIKAIFIYRLGDKEKQDRIENLGKNIDNFYFIQDAKEGQDICEKLGLYSS